MRASEIMETGAAVNAGSAAPGRSHELSLLLLQEIDDRDRRLIVLRVTYELEPHEIAVLLGETVEEISSDLRRLEYRVRELARTVSRAADPPMGLS